MKKTTIQLTSEQQKQIKDATGKTITELYMSVVPQGELSESDLGQVQGGAESISFSYGKMGYIYTQQKASD
jgi:hypothetical protein